MNMTARPAQLASKLAVEPVICSLAYRWHEAGASPAFVRGAIQELAKLVVGLSEHDRRFGKDSENRRRRAGTAARMRTLAKVLHSDEYAKFLTVLRLRDDEGPYRVEWLKGLATNRPTVAQVLTEGAAILESACGFGTVHIRRDVIIGVANILRTRHRIIEAVTGQRLSWPTPNKDIAAISTALIGQAVKAETVRKALLRQRSGTNRS